MIVSPELFYNCVEKLKASKVLALDTETTGLRPFHGDRLFSIIIHDGEQGYYFNFNDKNIKDKEAGIIPLDRTYLSHFKSLFEIKDILWILANAKFDLQILAQEDLFITGDIWDVLVMARLQYNDYFKYNLADCGKRIGFEKSDAVEEFISKYRCYKKEKIPGKKTEFKNKMFWMVPLEIIGPYGIQDAFVAFKLYEHQRDFFNVWDETAKTSIWTLVYNEMAFTKCCFEMERGGMRIDSDYCKKQLAIEEANMFTAMEVFKKETGQDLIDSYSHLKKSLLPLNIHGGETEKGNPSFTEEALSKTNHPVTKAILAYRKAGKRASSYYSSFLFWATSENKIHCNIRQSATKTSRSSISEPALQTIPAVNEDLTPEEVEDTRAVRRAFIVDPDCILVSIDYKAFEFRAMLDTAGEKELAQKIEQGHDPHQATADAIGHPRKTAKTVNFLLLFGGGAGKLAQSLGISLKDAQEIRSEYFKALPKIKELIQDSTYVAESRQRVASRFGRPYQFPDSKWAYKALNALIQGGTADAVKFALVRIQEYLNHFTQLKSRILLPIHDEILFMIHKDELYLIPIFKEIMEKAWPEKFHKMECSVEHSWKSWGDLEEGMPCGPEERNTI